MALLAHAVWFVSNEWENLDGLQPLPGLAAMHELTEDATTAIIQGFARLDPVSQTWFIGSIPRATFFEPIYEMVVADGNQLIQIAYLLFGIEGPDDPMIMAGLRGDDPALRTVAAAMAVRFGLVSPSP